MSLTIRPMRAVEREEVVELAVRIWAPVFASVNGVLGPEVARLLHGEDWREHQRLDTRRILESDSPDAMAWVGQREERLIGFSAAGVDPGRSIGEVRIVGHLYERLGFTLFPSALYLRTL